jgi:hypothetical protein
VNIFSAVYPMSVIESKLDILYKNGILRQVFSTEVPRFYNNEHLNGKY